MTYALFLDDERFPPLDGRAWLIARTVEQAQTTIRVLGWPSYISFDHDLGPGEATGFDFAKWLVESAMDGEPAFPEGWGFFIHSQNPVGKANIDGLIIAYLRSIGR